MDSMVVRDVEFIRWDDEDDEDTSLGWSTASEKSSRRRFLCEVCKDKDEERLQMMITSGWDVNEKFRQKRETFTSFGSIVLHDSFTALHQAARESWMDGVRMLLDNGANVDDLDFRDSRDRGWSYTALMHAANNGHMDLVKLLVEDGADVNTRDPVTHHSALLLAAVSCSIPCVQFLINHGADVNVIGCDNHMTPATPLLAAIYYYRLPQWHHLSHEWRSPDGRERSRLQALTLVRVLVENGCDVNAYGSDLPALHNSAGCKDPRALELLLKSGAEVNLVTDPERHHVRTTALAEAALSNNIRAVRMLLQHGADLKLLRLQGNESEDESTVSKLLKKKYYDIVAVLIFAGHNVTSAEVEAMKCVCASVTHAVDSPNLHDDDVYSEDEDDEAVLCNDLLNLSERSKVKRLKVEALKWALQFLSGPKSLKYVCRETIRSNMLSCSPKYIEELPLPGPIIRYIMYHDI